MEGKHNNVPGQQSTHKVQQLNTSPPSSSSSPSHEFSFTISLHPTELPEKNTTVTPPFAVDLSPADEIFFHGHLLPLHLLSHLPVSPRSSTNSLDTFTLPVKDLLPTQNHVTLSDTDIREQTSVSDNQTGNEERVKSKSFSLFGKSKLRKESDDEDDRERQRRSKFDVVRIVKSYMRSISFRSKKGRSNYQLPGGPHGSFSSGNLLVKGKKEQLVRGGLSSAPVSMRNSPTNSGHLVAKETSFLNPVKSASDSTMEELQAAIQAAIAHCKKSIAADDIKINNLSS